MLSKQGAFAAEDQPAKASAVLKLRRSNLPHEQSDAIRNLIAGSVEGLRPEAVTLVDADGRTDLSPGSRRGEDRENEVALQQKLIQVLEPLAGAGNVHATVNVSYLQGSEEHTDEVYDPQSATPVSTQRAEQTSQLTRGSGLAGASGNTPAAQPAAATNGTPAAAGTVAPGASASAQTAAGAPGQAQTSHDESTSYAVSRHVSHTEESPGRVRRLTAAIVVNDREIQQMSGRTMHTAWQHRSPDEMKRLQQLAQAAVGFDDKRGDQVVLENIAFSGNSDPAPASGVARLTEGIQSFLRLQPALPRMLVSGLGILLLGMIVLRPLTRQTQQLLLPLAKPQLLSAPPESSKRTDVSQETASGGQGAPLSTQHIFDRVTEQIKAEPQASTRLIGSWISAGAEEGE